MTLDITEGKLFSEGNLEERQRANQENVHVMWPSLLCAPGTKSADQGGRSSFFGHITFTTTGASSAGRRQSAKQVSVEFSGLGSLERCTFPERPVWYGA